MNDTASEQPDSTAVRRLATCYFAGRTDGFRPVTGEELLVATI